MNKESASGTAGFEPQAQSVEARGRCLGPISGSTRDPALQSVDVCQSACRVSWGWWPGMSRITVPDSQTQQF